MSSKTKTSPVKVWVLTREHNDYDQHGEYFEEVFAKKPSISEFADYFSKADQGVMKYGTPMEALSFIERLREGGGRKDSEDTWYNLKEVELK